MMYGRMTYKEALAKAEHLRALGQDVIYLEGDKVPWVVASEVEVGCGYRLNGPSGMYVIARVEGLTFKWNVDFEQCDANGRGVSMFDRDRLRDVARKLPPAARKSFADLLIEKVMPELTKRTAEIRAALNQQEDSEDCVRGLIAFASEQEANAA